MTVITHPPYFSVFPQLKIKLKGRYFDITEVIEAELQAMLNTLKITTSKIKLKIAEALGIAHMGGRELLQGCW
jgi:hypothetical protein